MENSSNIYCFYNASKFFAVIDDAFTGSKSLSQSQTPLRDGERSGERERENKRDGLADPSVYRAVDV